MANPYFSCVLDVWVSGNTVYARMHYWRSGTYTYTDSSFPTPSMTIDGTTFWDNDFANRVHNGIAVGDVYSTTFSKTVGSNGWKGASWSTGSGLRSDFAGDWSGGASVNFYIEGLWGNNLRRSQESFTLNVYLSNWGAGTNYRELQCWTYNASSLVTPRRWQPVYGGASSGDITVSNSSNGDLQIRGNTRYTLGVYADNGSTNTGSIRYGDATTLPYKDTLSLNKAHALSLDIDYSVPADGGRYDKTLQYSIDNGSSWITYDTISGGNAKTGTFTITGLAPITQYTIKSRVTTNNAAYIVNNNDITVSTIGPDTPTLSVDSFGNDNIVWKYGTSTFGGGTDGLVRLYVDQTATPETEVDTYDQTGDHTFSFTALPNTEYKARSRAESTFSGELVYSEWSNVISQVTLPPTPTANSMGVLQYDTATTVTVRTNTTIPSDGGHYPKTLEYRYKLGTGNYGAWTTATTHSETSALDYNIDIAGLPVDTLVTMQIRTSTTAGTTDSSTISVTTTGTHQPPTNFDYTVSDNNVALQSWLSTFSGYTNPIYVLGKSRAKVTVPVATHGTPSDNAEITDYRFSIPNDNENISFPYVEGSTMTGMFPEGIPEHEPTFFPSNMIAINGRCYDSLDTYSLVSKNILSLTWEEPTVEATAERLNDKGNALVKFSGTYARLQDASLNNGNDLNDITLEYRLEKFNGDVITDWTEITEYATSIDQDRPLRKNYSGNTTLAGLSYTEACVIKLRITDHFTSVVYEIPMEIWDGNRVIHPADYEIELWDWKTNTFVADISYLVVGNVNIEWALDDVEEVDFEIDLLRYEEKCREMGVDPKDLLAPYKHDIRIRRNGKYILGCQLVEANISLPNQPTALIQVKGTGFLNLLKDQYILQEDWSGYTYAQIARKLIQRAQQPDCVIKNPTCDIDTSYWLASSGIISHGQNGISGDGGCLNATRSGTGWIVIGTQMDVDSGVGLIVDVWIKGKSGDYGYLREREYLTQAGNQLTLAEFGLTGQWQRVQVPFTTFFKDGYLIIETDRSDSSTAWCIDECYIYAQDDDYALCNLHIPLGVDEASNFQSPTRQVSYELQNVKDGLMALTSLEDDNFDFDFNYDRTFNCYYKKGEEKLDLEVLYPGNIESMTIQRSASNLANKVYEIGSGIGDERLQVNMSNTPSRQVYGTRESVISNSNVGLESTLRAKAVGNLYDRKDPTNLPKIVIRDGSINPGNLQVGDYIPIQAQFDNYLETINGIYRVIEIRLSVDEDAVEQMTLTVEPPENRPEKKMIRYIRDSIVGNSSGANNSWNEIEALMLVGNEYINVALNKTVTGSAAFASGCPGSYAVNGDINNDAKIVGDGTRKAITIDLGDEYPIDYIKIWHWFADGRNYLGDHLSVGTTLPDGPNGIADLETVLWSYSDDGGYKETSNGRTSKWLQQDEITEGDSVYMVRYIRETHFRNNLSPTNIFTELDTWLEMESKRFNINYIGRVYPSFTGNYGYLGHINDQRIDAANYFSMGHLENMRQGVTIDLGAEYPISRVKLFHFLENARTFYGSRLTVGTSIPDSLDGIADLETVVWADGDSDGITETSAGRLSRDLQNIPANIKPSGRKIRFIKDTYKVNSLNDQKAWHDVNIYQIDKTTGKLKDVAIGLVPSCTTTLTNPTYATDGNTDTFAQTTEPGYQSVTFDLGEPMEIDYIRIKHHGDEKITYGNRLSVGLENTSGNDPLETIVWDDGETIGYKEPKLGRWSGWLQGGIVQNTVSNQRRPIRYIRDYIDGSGANTSNHWVTIEACVWQNNRWVDVALNKTVTANKTGESGHNNPQLITNGNTDSENYFGLATPGSAVTVDLGDTYYVDFVRVRHYYTDSRTYNHAKLSVGETLPENDDKVQPLEYTLWDSDVEPIGTENPTGKLSVWIQSEKLDGTS